MKVTITYDLNSCEKCPYKEHYHEQGFCGDFCNHPETKTIIKCNDEHFPTKCPFKMYEQGIP